MILYYDVKDDRKNSAVFYKKLEELFPESEPFIYVKLKYDPDKKIQVGLQLPEFTLKSFEEEIIYDNKYFNGKYLLLYFWNTTSEGIDVQISTLTTAITNFLDDNFEILSVSLDESWQNVVEYRLKQYPMRWNHSFEEYSFNSGVVKTFEVYKIPYLILVSPDGKILAIDDSLQGNKLIPTLTKFIKK
jgi:peroxiredoxin